MYDGTKSPFSSTNPIVRPEIIISVILTVIAGLVPSKIAAKKDPAVVLRSE